MSETPPPPYGSPGSEPPASYSGYAGPVVPYGAYGPAGVPPWAMPPEHPQANTVLVLGILSLVVCGLVGPFAWSMGNRVVGEIDAGAGRIGGRSAANAGRIIGMVATILLGVSLLLFVGIFAVALVPIATG